MERFNIGIYKVICPSNRILSKKADLREVRRDLFFPVVICMHVSAHTCQFSSQPYGHYKSNLILCQFCFLLRLPNLLDRWLSEQMLLPLFNLSQSHKYFQLGSKRKECQVSLVGHFCFVEIKTEVKEKLSSGITDEN